MKPLSRLLIFGIACLSAAHAGQAASILGFDDLPSGGPLDVNPPVVPNGYGGLHWNNFAVVDGLQFSAEYGYYAGVVSSRNEIFNPFGSPASIGISSGLFDLDSAYFTAALNLNTSLQIEVQGLRRGVLLYDNSYTVTRTAPTFVNLSYFGVDQVRFTPTPGQQFVIDNLAVAIPEPEVLALLVFAIASICLPSLPRCRFTPARI